MSVPYLYWGKHEKSWVLFKSMELFSVVRYMVKIIMQFAALLLIGQIVWLLLDPMWQVESFMGSISLFLYSVLFKHLHYLCHCPLFPINPLFFKKKRFPAFLQYFEEVKSSKERHNVEKKNLADVRFLVYFRFINYNRRTSIFIPFKSSLVRY